jgi:hypothetical protein
MSHFNDSGFRCGDRVLVDQMESTCEGTVTRIAPDMDGGALLTVRTDAGEYVDASDHACTALD